MGAFLTIAREGPVLMRERKGSKNLSIYYVFPFFLWSSLLTPVQGIRFLPKSHLQPLREKLKRKGFIMLLKAHQTLYRICKTYGVDIRDVAKQNGITDVNRIQDGTADLHSRGGKSIDG